MGKITTVKELRGAIQELEQKQAGQWLMLKEEVTVVYENLKPVNLIKNALYELSSSEGIIDNTVSAMVGIITGLFSRKMVVGKSNNIFRNIFGSFIQAAVTNIITRHPDLLKSLATRIIDSIFGKKDTNPAEPA